MNDQTTHKHCGGFKLHAIWWMLKLTYGGAALLLGLDKFFNIITVWPNYLSPVVMEMIPASVLTLIKVVGVAEIVVGLLILTFWPRFGAYLMALWILLVMVNLASLGMHYDLIARDLIIFVGVFCFALLTSVVKSDCN